MCFAVESPPAGAEINIFQMELGIMVENISSDSRLRFTDIVVMVNKSQLSTCSLYDQTSGHWLFINVQTDYLLLEVNVCTFRQS